jgi:CheY-like chemotaxis protein
MDTRSYQRVLMVDDDEDDCVMATEAFAENGVKASFSCVYDGVRLIDHLSECLLDEKCKLPRLILLDLNMPRKSGREVLAMLRAHPGFQNIPVVILTTSDKDDVLPATLEMADGFVTKPATFEEWVAMMRPFIDRWLAG